MITAQIDTSSFKARLTRLGQILKDGPQHALIETGNEVMRLSQEQVPHDEGTLQNSGTVQPNPDGSVDVGYHTPYAARLHEHPEYHFQNGRKGKYLEDPVADNLGPLGLKFGSKMDEELSRG